MFPRPRGLTGRTVVLPRGTRVVLRTEIEGEDGIAHRAGSAAVVRTVAYHTYGLETPGGRRLSAQRDQIEVSAKVLSALGARQWDFERLRDEVVYAAVVGSRAWGLATPDSDRDVRGCFLAPFDDASGLWRCPDEIRDPAGDSAHWEVGKLVELALRGDANALECLWSPEVETMTPLGERIRERRDCFVSMNVLGSFGRYAQSQLKKMARSAERTRVIRGLLDELGRAELTLEEAAAWIESSGVADGPKAARREIQLTCRSLFDRGLLPSADFDALSRSVRAGAREHLEPEPYRPKNAYNLLRLLYSCVSWMRAGEPMIVVPEPLRSELLDVKEQRVEIDEVMRRAGAVAEQLDEAAKESTLPESPDYAAADDLLRSLRRAAARRALAAPSSPDGPPLAAGENDDGEHAPSLLPVELPADVETGPVQSFLTRYLDPDSPRRIALVCLALSGAHAYGFPSPDSDLDLKGIHVAPAEELLGLHPTPQPVEHLGDWHGREYDFSSNELGAAARLLLRGNGNMLERLLGPFPVVHTPAGQRLAELAAASLSRHACRHYRGFLKGMRREYAVEARRGERRVKRLLYAYRVALTGLHLLESGELVTDVRPLAETYGLGRVAELVAIKSSGERALLDAGTDAPYLEDLDALDRRLETACERSVLPAAPPNADAVEGFVIEQRLALTRRRREAS